MDSALAHVRDVRGRMTHLTRDFLEILNDVQCLESIKPRRRLIKEKRLYIRKQLGSNRSPLPLSTRDTAITLRSYTRIPAFLQAKHVDRLFYALFFGCWGEVLVGQAQLGGEA